MGTTEKLSEQDAPAPIEDGAEESLITDEERRTIEFISREYTEPTPEDKHLALIGNIVIVDPVTTDRTYFVH